MLLTSNDKGLSSDVSQSIMVQTLRSLERRGVVGANDSFLIVFAGSFDQAAFKCLGYDRFVLSNVDAKQVPSELSHQADARNLPFDAASFDHVVAHAGLHHTSQPHRALCEMYRVAKRSVIFFEAQDSLLMRTAIRLGMVQEYEWNAIFDSSLQRGGVDDKPLPNYVYRWTCREVEKLVRSADPLHVPDILFFRKWNFYYDRVARRISRTFLKRIPKVILEGLCWLVVTIANLITGRWGNSFAVCIRKAPRQLQPWIECVDGQYRFKAQAVVAPATDAFARAEPKRVGAE